MDKRSKGGWWIFTLFAINEIPSVVVTFVALIMFLQMGVGMMWSTVCAAGLLLPWVVQPVLRPLLAHTVDGRKGAWWLMGTECLMAAMLLLSAMQMGGSLWRTVAVLMCISTLSAWHDLMARRYYGTRVNYNPGKWQRTMRNMASQVTTVLTYGLMIMAVGVLEIYFRQKAMWYSWALCSYILAGTYLLLVMINMVLMDRTEIATVSAKPYSRPENWWGHVAVLALLLLPQGLMFFSRTIFLLERPQQGGLGCTLQEVGFAQGTIGVMALLVGIVLGRMIQRRYGEDSTEKLLTVCLGLSPLMYLMMTEWRPSGLCMLSGYTFAAQLMFGMGLNGCRRRIAYISGERYRNAVNPLYIPVISLCLMLPMAASGYMIENMSFRVFFLLDTLCAPLCWVIMQIPYGRLNRWIGGIFRDR